MRRKAGVSPRICWITALLLAVAPSAQAASGSYVMDQPVYVLANATPGWTAVDYAVGDVTGDGLADIVVSLSIADPDGPAGPAEASGAIRILRQRVGGFDFGVTTPVACVPGHPLLADISADPGKEVLFPCATDTYDSVVRGFVVLDMDGAGAVTLSPRQVDPDMGKTPLSLVDADQDGREDLFYTYSDDDPATLDIEYRAILWYNRESGFTRWQGRRFLYSGIDWAHGPRSIYPQAERVDVDGDGTQDSLQGYCPQICAFLGQPSRQLAMHATTADVQDFAGPRYGDLDGDGLPDRIQSDWSTQAAWIQLQTSPLVFEDVGRIWPIELPGVPTIQDFDLNGLADIALASERDLILFLQQSPGSFANASQGLGSYLSGMLMAADDLTGDLCPDLLSLNQAGQGEAYFQLFRGMRCQTPGDLALQVSWTMSGVDVTVRQVAGAKVFQDTVVRVNIAAAMDDDRSIGLVLAAPAQCVPVAAAAPRHVFDCLLAPIAPGQEAHLLFTAQPTKFATDFVPMQAVAFLLDNAGDARASNNRGFAASNRGKRMTASDPTPRGVVQP